MRCNISGLDLWQGPLPRDVQRAVRDAVVRPDWWDVPSGRWRDLRRGVAFALLIPLVTSAPIWISLWWPRVLPSGYALPVTIVLAIGTIPMMFWYAPAILPARHCRWIARNVALRGFCGSCGYKLPDAVAPTGYYICSECGSSWDRGAPEADPQLK